MVIADWRLTVKLQTVGALLKHVNKLKEVEKRKRRNEMSRKSIAYAYTAGETCHLLYPTTLEQDQDEGSNRCKTF